MDAEAIEAAAGEFAATHDVPGLAFGVVMGGELAIGGAVGLREVGTGAPAGAETVWRIASMTKSVTAACVLSLRDAGSLALDDAAARHVPELAGWALPTSDSQPPTLRQLLSMSGGLVDDNAWGDRHLDMPEEELSAMLSAGVPFHHPPAVAYEYSNLGYAILGRVVANVSGEPFASYATRTILAPLGMGDSTWEVGMVPAGRRAHGYRREDGSWKEEAPLGHGAFGAMGGLWTTIADLARWVAFHLGAWPPRDGPEDGPLRRSSAREMAQLCRLDEESAAKALAPGASRDPLAPIGYGFGLDCGVHPDLGRVVGHSGGLPGFGSRMTWLPDCGAGFFVLANRTYAPTRELVARMVGELGASGDLRRRPRAVSPVLAAARHEVVALYEHWDEERARAMAADNLALDQSLARRGEEVAALRRSCGRCVEVGDLQPRGDMRGEWKMVCEGGQVEASVSLAPTRPPRIQSLTWRRVEPTG
jgi:D-alanyl-D-alanine-carboxypeptidase/D-alanyl-D-alanine-endopeptidase